MNSSDKRRSQGVGMAAVVFCLAIFGVAGNGYAAGPEIEMIQVKGGCFMMGTTEQKSEPDEAPVHEVCLDSFSIGTYEVTQAQWSAVMDNNPARFSGCGEDCPVERVSWNDAQEFIKQLNSLTGKKYRLPTEAEWEYAARSGGKKERWAGTGDPAAVAGFAWYAENSGEMTHPAGMKSPNGLGIHDMSGNVWEWVQDWYDPTYYAKGPRQNPQGPASGERRVFRGGSWDFNKVAIRTTIRLYESPDYRSEVIGFRLVRTD